MDLSTLVFGTAFTALPLIAAVLLTAMVLLERHSERLSPAHGARGRRPRGRRPTCRARRA